VGASAPRKLRQGPAPQNGQRIILSVLNLLGSASRVRFSSFLPASL
jgi:hypothetical protein